MGFKDELKRDMRNLLKDVERETEKQWEVEYEGHRIVIVNKLMEEHLFIDGKKVDSNIRKSIWSHTIPYSTLTGFLETAGGKKKKVSVKLGGWKNLNCIVKVGGKQIFTDTKVLSFLPWEHKEKIVPFLKKQIETTGKIVNYTLPDEDLFFGDQERLEPGLSDQLEDGIPTPFFTKKLLKRLEEQLKNPTTKTRKATYEEIIFDRIANYRLEFIEMFPERGFDEASVQREALWFLENAAHREVVKFALIVLGLTNCEKYIDLIFTIGQHDEFTEYAIFALKNGAKGGSERIWQLARSVNGWGRYFAIQELEAHSEEIKYWLLTDGCKNSSVRDYIAYMCAVKGELDVALHETEISKELYEGAALIITGLLSEEAYSEIDEYPYTGQVFNRFVYHAQKHCQNVEDFYPLLKVYKYLDEDEEVWEERFNHNWKPFEKDELSTAIAPFINDNKWGDLALESLRQGYDAKAVEIARFYERDITPILFDLMEENPTKDELYSAFMQTNNRDAIEKMVDFVEAHFSLNNLPDEEQQCLEAILQELYDYEGVGLSLIQAALNSKADSLQHHALSVLEYWKKESWQTAEILSAIKDVAMTTDEKYIRQMAKQLLEE